MQEKRRAAPMSLLISLRSMWISPSSANFSGSSLVSSTRVWTCREHQGQNGVCFVLS